MWFSLCLSVILLRSVSCVFTIKIGLDIFWKIVTPNLVATTVSQLQFQIVFVTFS